MTELILIRHGETAWNAEHRIQGHLDSPLNDEGLAQALLLGERLAREPPAISGGRCRPRSRSPTTAASDRCPMPACASAISACSRD